MICEQRIFTESKGWKCESRIPDGGRVQLALVFGATSLMKENRFSGEIRAWYPNAIILGCSTSGEIYGTHVFDNTVTVTAIQFNKTIVKGCVSDVSGAQESYPIGQRLAQGLDHTGLSHVFVLSDGLKVNGTELVRGLVEHLPDNVGVTGGLSGDGPNFKETYVMWNDSSEKNRVAAIGFYGPDLKIGYASLGGWDPFGPERKVTRSKGNVLYELNGQSALELYKKYLGEHAAGLPATGLLFPLSLKAEEDREERVVRTILAVDEEQQSLTFAGDIPENTMVRFMKANFDRLIDGAVKAAQKSRTPIGDEQAQLAILISCVGRKLILKQRVEEEVEGVRDILGQATLTGFYSYGEISPFTPGAKCELHNQTMTITTFGEV
ncbi:MAG: FIST N-terminal domain-containing protein [Candidatus Omnitrophica bacterium]|nr:FIST N-terminal domain-containing protein [Candidatus Omnitrophota bacterium]